MFSWRNSQKKNLYLPRLEFSPQAMVTTVTARGLLKEYNLLWTIPVFIVAMEGNDQEKNTKDQTVARTESKLDRPR